MSQKIKNIVKCFVLIAAVAAPTYAGKCSGNIITIQCGKVNCVVTDNITGEYIAVISKQDAARICADIAKTE
jgi:hypothetical protein